MTTSDIVKRFIDNINAGVNYEVVVDEMSEFVRPVKEDLEYDDHGNAELTHTYSIALNDETRDVQFVQVYRYVESGEQSAWRVAPKIEVVTKYVRV